jgi:hypothetical protein
MSRLCICVVTTDFSVSLQVYVFSRVHIEYSSQTQGGNPMAMNLQQPLPIAHTASASSSSSSAPAVTSPSGGSKHRLSFHGGEMQTVVMAEENEDDEQNSGGHRKGGDSDGFRDAESVFGAGNRSSGNADGDDGDDGNDGSSGRPSLPFKIAVEVDDGEADVEEVATATAAATTEQPQVQIVGACAALLFFVAGFCFAIFFETDVGWQFIMTVPRFKHVVSTAGINQFAHDYDFLSVYLFSLSFLCARRSGANCGACRREDC